MSLAGVHVEQTGAGPRTVVLLHGFSDNANTWRRVVPALATRYRVLALDLPGHGRSSRPWSRPLLEGYARLVGEVLDAYGVERASLVGNSMGACTATVFADAYPQRAERIVLIGMPGVGRVPLTWRLAATRPSVALMRAGLSQVPVPALQRGFGWVYAHATTPHPGVLGPHVLHDYFDVYADRERLFGLGAIARSLLHELHTRHLDRLLEGSAVPALHVWGRHDRLVPHRHARSLPGAVVLPDCGHCPQLDAPDRLLSVLLPFLEPAEALRPTARERVGARTRAARS